MALRVPGLWGRGKARGHSFCAETDDTCFRAEADVFREAYERDTLITCTSIKCMPVREAHERDIFME